MIFISPIFRTPIFNCFSLSAQHAFLNRFVMGADLGTECKAPEKENKVTESNRKRPARLLFYRAGIKL